MSMREILEELPRLARVEREKVWQRLEEIESEKIEETPEMLAAIDEGIHSAENESSYPVEAVRAEIPSWLAKSS